jgi:hypothetical protein
MYKITLEEKGRNRIFIKEKFILLFGVALVAEEIS